MSQNDQFIEKYTKTKSEEIALSVFHFYSWIIKKRLNEKTYFLIKHSPFSTFAVVNNDILIDCQKSVVHRYSNGLYWILENSVEHFHTFLKIWTLYTCMHLDLHLQFEHIKLFPRTLFTECWKRLFYSLNSM